MGRYSLHGAYGISTVQTRKLLFPASGVFSLPIFYQRLARYVCPMEGTIRFATVDQPCAPGAAPTEICHLGRKKFHDQSTRFATIVLFFRVLYTWTPPRMQARGKFEGLVWDFEKIASYNLGGDWNLGWRSNVCHLFEGTLKGLKK